MYADDHPSPALISCITEKAVGVKCGYEGGVAEVFSPAGNRVPFFQVELISYLVYPEPPLPPCSNDIKVGGDLHDDCESAEKGAKEEATLSFVFQCD